MKKRDLYLRRKYGLTLAQYDTMLTMGKGACWICRKAKTKAKHARRLSVEHDHVNGRVRGLACFPCNFRLIRRLRNAGLLRHVADYLDSTFDGRALTPGAAAPSFLGRKRKSTTPPPARPKPSAGDTA